MEKLENIEISDTSVKSNKIDFSDEIELITSKIESTCNTTS
jgi:hypothetical protein